MAYDFGFCWDGEHTADWQCDYIEGTITWSNRYDLYSDIEEDKYDDLGDDLHVTYSSGTGSGHTVLGDAAVTDPTSRDEWVATAEKLFGFLRSQQLI